ncbi:PD-(D/E)XK nuclease family protein [Haloarcula argentinensis]|uniref:PD-(D/E)XK nuclease family protein n=1 Tax=Haloarcula argentinensis TaxID=43776 RepID=A0A830FWP3_HALAR|nr:PD-(D/E)XK nuclease family protein [Haloarcula argentinensis]GGM50546.1 hypothetical protein GCM10009006_34590 [Haloarcula argentinensis]
MEDLDSRLEEFASEIQRLSTDAEHPKTAFELLGVGQYEDAWQSYLQYFLTPDQTHQFGGEFLRRFFSLLSNNEVISFSPPETGLRPDQGIEVTAERQSSDDNRPDLIITSGSEWFLCIELKVHASEGRGDQPQSIRYANDEHIVPDGVSAYEDGDFIYIKPREATPPASASFSDLAWGEVQSVVQDTLANTTEYAPARTIAQLSDFSTLIDSQLSMTEIDEDTRQRKDLYFEYRDEITEAENAIETFVKSTLQQNWRQALEGPYKPGNDQEIEWQYGAIGKGYGQVRTPRWVSAKSGSEELDIHWEHKPTEDDFTKGQLRFILELEEPDRSTMDNDSGERYQQFRSDILAQIETAIQPAENPRWEEVDVSPGRSQKKLARFVYEYQAGDENGYYQSLQFALEDSEPVSRLVTEILDAEDYTRYLKE